MQEATEDPAREALAAASEVPESPKPTAFVIDFGEGKIFDTQRHKTLLEKYQKRHKRGQSLSKLEDVITTKPRFPHTGNLPRKASFQSEGYFSSDEKTATEKNVRAASAKKSDLTLPLKNMTSEQMTQSFPNSILPSILSPEELIKDTSSPELDSASPSASPISPKMATKPKLVAKQPQIQNSPSNDIKVQDLEQLGDDFDKSDSLSDAGTYTLEGDNYSEEQKQRMSIDRHFKIEQISGNKKTEQYIKSLGTFSEDNTSYLLQEQLEVSRQLQKEMRESEDVLNGEMCFNKKLFKCAPSKKLSPILSPTQNVSFTQTPQGEKPLNTEKDNKAFTKIIYPSEKSRGRNGLDELVDRGNVISVTSSGAFRPTPKEPTPQPRRPSLAKSEVQVETYMAPHEPIIHASLRFTKPCSPKLSANIINVQNISIKSSDLEEAEREALSAKLVLGKLANLPPCVGGMSSGKASPSKIPSPIHSLSRPRSRSSSISRDLSDSSNDTESYLQPTRNIINTLQQRLSLDSDQDSDYEKYTLNNTPNNLLKQKTKHTRNNSLDDRSTKVISNKLEHFQNKNLQQSIDQTYMLNQYQHKIMQKIQNSPNNSPIRRSSSFSNKNYLNTGKNTNIQQETRNNSPHLGAPRGLQRSSSSAQVKPNHIQQRRQSFGSERPKIDRNKFGDTESSSEDDFEKHILKRSSNLTQIRYNRSFNIRRARLDSEPTAAPQVTKSSNTPEMKPKFTQAQDRTERAFSVDRKPRVEVQSRYLSNISKKPAVSSPVVKQDANKTYTVKNEPTKSTPSRPTAFSRVDSGRFSMRTPKSANSVVKTAKKETTGSKKLPGRSNSTLTSKEVDRQNWKRRISYDPMKAAAEGKRKEIEKRQSNQSIMTQSFTESSRNDPDSSPSHSSSVHRSQSFHGTAALEQIYTSEEEEEEDLTLSADEGFSPPTPSPCEMSPAKNSIRSMCRERIAH